jgi:hypothetical protein
MNRPILESAFKKENLYGWGIWNKIMGSRSVRPKPRMDLKRELFDGQSADAHGQTNRQIHQPFPSRSFSKTITPKKSLN